MRFFTSLFTAACAVAAVASIPLTTRDVPTVEADIATISSQVTTLNNDINAFPTTGGTLTEALQIHTDATTLDTSIKKATTDTQATTGVSETDGQTILAAVQAFEPTIITALQDIVTKKAAFAALPIGGLSALVLQDLKSLQTDTAAFATALIAAAPADLQSQATTLANNINAAFTTAVAAFSS